MLGMQPAGHKKVQNNQGFLTSPKINRQKQILATPSNTLKIDFQKHDNAGDVSQ